MVVLDASIMSTALQSIAREFDVSTDTLSWVVNAYVLAFGGLLLLGGRAADLIGRRRVFIGGLVFAGASLAGGPAASAEQLIAARASKASVPRRRRPPPSRSSPPSVPRVPSATRDRRGTTLVPTDTSYASRMSTGVDTWDAGDAPGRIYTHCPSAGGRKVAGSNPVAPSPTNGLK